MAAQQTLDDPVAAAASSSLESTKAVQIPNGTLSSHESVNEAVPPPPPTSDVEDEEEAEKSELRQSYARVKSEKEQLETQYRSLLAKLTSMRNTLGDKLKQDAVGLPLHPLYCSS